jgi:cytochrome c oxidase cbb3-type subunit IV
MFDSYEAAVHFTESWGLIYFFLAFVVVLILVLRPSLKGRYEHAAHLPIREDD